MVVRDASSFLRHVLLADGAVSGATGLLMAAAAPVLAPWLGLPTALLQVAGVCLIPFGAALVMLARAQAIPAPRVWLVIAANVAWVAGSGLLMLLGPASLTLLGYVFVAFQALVVALLADLQWLANRQRLPRTSVLAS